VPHPPGLKNWIPKGPLRGWGWKSKENLSNSKENPRNSWCAPRVFRNSKMQHKIYGATLAVKNAIPKKTERLWCYDDSKSVTPRCNKTAPELRGL